MVDDSRLIRIDLSWVPNKSRTPVFSRWMSSLKRTVERIVFLACLLVCLLGVKNEKRKDGLVVFVEKKGSRAIGLKTSSKQVIFEDLGKGVALKNWRKGGGGTPSSSSFCPIMLGEFLGIKPWRCHRVSLLALSRFHVNFCWFVWRKKCRKESR